MTKRTGALAVIALTVIGGIYSMAGRAHAKASRRNGIVFAKTWTGSAHSAWFYLAKGVYDVSERNRPLGCVGMAALVGTNEYRVVDLPPNFAPHVPNFKGGARWAGYTAHLVAGTYRVEGQAVPGCRWSVRVTRDP